MSKTAKKNDGKKTKTTKEETTVAAQFANSGRPNAGDVRTVAELIAQNDCDTVIDLFKTCPSAFDNCTILEIIWIMEMAYNTGCRKIRDWGAERLSNICCNDDVFEERHKAGLLSLLEDKAAILGIGDSILEDYPEESYNLFLFLLNVAEPAIIREITAGLSKEYWCSIVNHDFCEDYELLKALLDHSDDLPNLLKIYSQDIGEYNGDDLCRDIAYQGILSEDNLGRLLSVAPALAVKLMNYVPFNCCEYDLAVAAIPYLKKAVKIDLGKMMAESIAYYNSERLAQFLVLCQRHPDKIELKGSLRRGQLSQKVVMELFRSAHGRRVLQTFPKEWVIAALTADLGSMITGLSRIFAGTEEVDAFVATITTAACEALEPTDEQRVINLAAQCICDNPALKRPFFEKLLHQDMLRLLARTVLKLVTRKQLDDDSSYSDLTAYCQQVIDALGQGKLQHEMFDLNSEAPAPETQTAPQGAVIGQRGNKLFIELHSGRILTVDLATEEVQLNGPIDLQQVSR